MIFGNSFESGDFKRLGGINDQRAETLRIKTADVGELWTDWLVTSAQNSFGSRVMARLTQG